MTKRLADRPSRGITLPLSPINRRRCCRPEYPPTPGGSSAICTEPKTETAFSESRVNRPERPSHMLEREFPDSLFVRRGLRDGYVRGGVYPARATPLRNHLTRYSELDRLKGKSSRRMAVGNSPRHEVPHRATRSNCGVIRAHGVLLPSIKARHPVPALVVA